MARMDVKWMVWVGMLLGGSALWGDVLIKNDGTRLTGDVKREGDTWVVVGTDGKRVVVNPADVRGVELNSGGAGGGGGGDVGLASLRRAMESQADPKKAVDRYRQFIEANKGTKVAEDASVELAVWEERLAKQMMKIGSKWYEPEEAFKIRAAATEKAKEAIVALRENRQAPAEDALNAALALDPGNATALYVRGVMMYRLDKFADARKAFEACLAVAGPYGPALNNLAVTVYRMNQQSLAMNFYEQAMVALPLDRGLLNNVAEALEALPANLKNTPLAKRLKKKFDEQDAVLAQRLAQQGLFRWGATWVTREQMAQIQAAEQQVKQALEQLAAQYDALAQKMMSIDVQVKGNESELQRLYADTYRYDSTGKLVQLPLPPSYFTLRQQTDQLKADRLAAEQGQSQIRSKARDVQKQIPIPRYTGIQQLYAAEAAPVPVIPGQAAGEPGGPGGAAGGAATQP